PYIGRFTVRDAERAGLWMNAKRKPWVHYPKRMLFNRARAFALRDGFADALAGLSITEEVLDTLPPVEEAAKLRPPSLADDEPVTELPQEPPQDALEREEAEGQGEGTGEPEKLL
ncbi:MAG: hypothetical protein ACREBK_03065, partial [Sphingomicrobium sp.]